jgi:hypothetical protein
MEHSSAAIDDNQRTFVNTSDFHKSLMGHASAAIDENNANNKGPCRYIKLKVPEIRIL